METADLALKSLEDMGAGIQLVFPSVRLKSA